MSCFIIDLSIINDSEKSYGQLISKVCDSVKENVIMSIAVNEDRRGLRLIQTILSLSISIDEQVSYYQFILVKFGYYDKRCFHLKNRN